MLYRPKPNNRVRDTFAKVLMVCTWIGLGIMVFFGSLYFLGFKSSVGVWRVAENWNKPVTQFWLSVRGEQAHGFSWFLPGDLHMDSLAMTGILLLSLTPLIALISIIWRMKGLYLVLLIILVAEFLFSVFRPLL
jgi:hypothetical protein